MWSDLLKLLVSATSCLFNKPNVSARSSKLIRLTLVQGRTQQRTMVNSTRELRTQQRLRVFDGAHHIEER